MFSTIQYVVWCSPVPSEPIQFPKVHCSISSCIHEQHRNPRASPLKVESHSARVAVLAVVQHTTPMSHPCWKMIRVIPSPKCYSHTATVWLLYHCSNTSSILVANNTSNTNDTFLATLICPDENRCTNFWLRLSTLNSQSGIQHSWTFHI